MLANAAALAQDADKDLEPIVVIAGSDPIITFIRADSLEHKGKVVSQSCTTESTEDKESKRETRHYDVSGPNAFTWQIDDLQIDGKPASDKDMKKARKKLDKRNDKREPEDDERYGMFADLVADKDRIEKLPPENGMLRYRINRLPDKLTKDMPGAIASRLKPVLWIADAEGDPYVRKMEISLADFRLYLVAKVNAFNFTMEFERRPDGYVRERRGVFDADFSFFGSRKQARGSFTCDIGGAVVARTVPSGGAVAAK
jgi:hypothetical protein